MTNIPTIDGHDVLDPGLHDRYAQQLGTPADVWQRANSYCCPRGPDPGTAWLLVSRATIDALDKNGMHTLEWISKLGRMTVENLIFVRALCMNLALAGDTKAAYLLELADVRHLARMSVLNASYNVRQPVPPATSGDDLYYDETLSGGTTTWTWATLLANIWAELPSNVGAAPSLPSTPNGTPENMSFEGVSAWDALHYVLDQVGCTTAFDPTTGVFSYVLLKDAQSGLAAAETILTNRLMYDYDPVEGNAARVPENVEVYFRVVDDEWGTDLDRSLDTSSFEDRFHVETVASGASGVIAGTKVVLHDDLLAVLESDGTVTNQTALTNRSIEVADNYVTGITTGQARDRKHYAGITTDILPGSQVKSATWRDYGDEAGLVTEVLRGPQKTPEPLRKNRSMGNPRQILLRASQDIANGSSGTANLVTATGGTLVELSGAINQRTVYNHLLPKIWDDSYLIAETQNGTLIATAAFSATLIRGLLATPSRLAPTDSTGLINFISPYDGEHFASGIEAITVDNPRSLSGVFGAEAIAGWNDSLSVWEFIWIGELALFVEFTLTEDMGATTAGQASATRNESYGTPELSIDPGSTITVYDRMGKAANMKSGDKGVAAYDREANKYTVISQDHSSAVKMYRVSDTGHIANGTSGTANLVTVSGGTLTETETSETIYNHLLPKIWDNSYMAVADFAGTLVAIAAYSATMLRGLQVGALLATDADNVIDNLNALNGHFDASTATPKNLLDWAADDNAETYAVWNDEDGQWEMIQADGCCE